MAATHDVRVAETTAEYTGCATSGKTYSSGVDSIALDAYPLHYDHHR